MRRSRIIGLSVILSCWLAHPALAQKKVPDGAKVFLLSGGQRQHHGYREQALYLSGALENTGRFQVTIGEDAAILETPAMRKYDLLIVTADRRDPEFKFTPGQQEAIFDFVRSGHGYVSIHGADNAPKDWLPPWKEMLGGIYSHVGKPDGKARKGSYTVKIADTASPVTQGLKDFRSRMNCTPTCRCCPTSSRWPRSNIKASSGPWPGPTPSARAGSSTRPSATATSVPTRTTRSANPNLNKLIIQGIDWVAAGRAPTEKTAKPAP